MAGCINIFVALIPYRTLPCTLVLYMYMYMLHWIQDKCKHLVCPGRRGNCAATSVSGLVFCGLQANQVVLEKQEMVSRRRSSFSCFCSWCGRGLFSVLCIVNSSYPGKQTELFSIPLQAKGLCTSLSLGLALLCVYLPDLNHGSGCISVSHSVLFCFYLESRVFCFPSRVILIY